MKFILHDGGELSLPIKLGYHDRVELINNEILHNENHEHYYNKNSYRLSDGSIENIAKRWIGIKRVNMPHPDETLKTSFDILSTYLVYSKDHSATSEISRFEHLMMKKRDALSKNEEKELNKLTKNVIYFKLLSKGNSKNIVFYNNSRYEKFLDQKIKDLYNEDVYCDSDLERTKRRLKQKQMDIGYIKNEVKASAFRIDNKKENIKFLKGEIKTLYQELKSDKKNLEIVNDIKDKINNIKSLRKDIEIIEDTVRNLTDDYLQITELYI